MVKIYKSPRQRRQFDPLSHTGQKRVKKCSKTEATLEYRITMTLECYNQTNEKKGVLKV